MGTPNRHNDYPNADLFRRIGDICNAVTVTLNARDLLDVSLTKTLELFTARRGSIFIVDTESGELSLAISRGMEEREQKQLAKRLGYGVVGRVAEEKKPLVVADIASDERFKNYKPRKSYASPSFICAPLLIKDQLIGVINITDKEGGKPFTADELQVLDFLSAQIALNYRRTQLYQKFKDTIKESKSLKDELGKKAAVTDHLQQKVVVQERLASLGKLAGGIAHELNNPLDGVLRYVNLSLGHLHEDDVIYGYLQEVKHGLNRMVTIVKSLLACSRNDLPPMRKISLNDAVDEVVSSLSSDIFHKNITIKKDLAAGLAAIIDMGIERIISNLLRNAIDAVEDGGRIEIRTAHSGPVFILEVQDFGSGIARDTLEHIFEPFYTTKEIDKGCGLGLTIVSEIVKAYNGKIDVETTYGNGTTFRVTMPAQQEYAQHAA